MEWNSLFIKLKSNWVFLEKPPPLSPLDMPKKASNQEVWKGGEMAECSLLALVNISCGCCHIDEAPSWKSPGSVGVASHEEFFESASCQIAGYSLLRWLRDECSQVKYIFIFLQIFLYYVNFFILWNSRPSIRFQYLLLPALRVTGVSWSL